MATSRYKKQRSITLAEAKEILRGLGISLRKQDGEYAVYPRGQVDLSYFTDDIDDAVATGLVMAQARDPQKPRDGEPQR